MYNIHYTSNIKVMVTIVQNSIKHPSTYALTKQRENTQFVCQNVSQKAPEIAPEIHQNISWEPPRAPKTSKIPPKTSPGHKKKSSK